MLLVLVHNRILGKLRSLLPVLHRILGTLKAEFLHSALLEPLLALCSELGYRSCDELENEDIEDFSVKNKFGLKLTQIPRQRRRCKVVEENSFCDDAVSTGSKHVNRCV
jgi:hypothetical protein